MQGGRSGDVATAIRYFLRSIDGLTLQVLRSELGVVSTGVRPGLVTVALETWHSDCKPTRPTRGGVVCLGVETTRVPVSISRPHPSRSRTSPVLQGAHCTKSSNPAFSRFFFTIVSCL